VAHQRLTGLLLVGGRSTRFGSPKALARLDGETLAERCWRLLAETCDECIAVGKSADALSLPFPVLDDGAGVRAPLAGVVAGLRAARTDACVVLPVDCPLLRRASLERLAEAVTRAPVAIAPSGPLPGAYHRAALDVLERSLEAGRYALRDAIARLRVEVVPLDPVELVNVNTKAELEALRSGFDIQVAGR
jgi:molybdenum cofactor guanylyltransferase